jgi:hypothetical protein
VRRSFLTAILPALAALLLAPAGAHARSSCGAEQSAPTSANSVLVSDVIFCLTNQVRASFGLPALRRDARLDAAARLHSQDMSARAYFAHVTPEGLTPSDRATAHGYFSGVGENIAYGYRNAAEAMIGWMASAGHCRNILGSARDIGIGTAGAATPYFTQTLGDYDFGASAAASAACPYALDLDALTVPRSPGGDGPPPGAAGPAADGGPEVAAPAAGPVLSGFALSPGRLRAGGRGSIRYTLSAPATVTVRVERELTGRRAAGGRCVAPAPADRRAPRCVRYRTLPGSVTDAGEQGPNAFAFRARLRGRPLAPGGYRLRAVATDAGGSASTPRRVRVVVVRR